MLFKLLVFKSQLFQTSCVQSLNFKPQVVTLHLRIALPARQCTLLALRYVFNHSWLIIIEKAKSTIQNVRCTIYPVHIAHAQQMSFFEQLPFRRESILTVCCQQNVGRDGKWKYFVKPMSSQPRFLEDIHPRTAQPSWKIPLLTELGWVILLLP